MSNYTEYYGCRKGSATYIGSCDCDECVVGNDNSKVKP